VTAGPEHGRPTLKTIAKICGLSVPTVSRALSDAPDIGDATKAQVREVADRIGYVPNRAGLRLRTGKTFVVACLLSREDAMFDHMGRVIEAIANELWETPYNLIVSPIPADSDEMEPVTRIVSTGMADGLILHRTSPDDARVAYLMERKVPFVTYGRTKWHRQHAYYDYDNVAFGRRAVAELVAAGRTHIALLTPPPEQNFARDLTAGARAAAAEAGVAFEVIEGLTSDCALNNITRGVEAFLRDAPAVDGMLCHASSGTVAAVIGAEAAGRKIGRDFDIVSKEPSDFLPHFRPGILSLREDLTAAGTYLAQAVVHAIEKPEAPAMQRLDAVSGVARSGTTATVQPIGPDI
jgi:LacI family transcriptional regulator